MIHRILIALITFIFLSAVVPGEAMAQRSAGSFGVGVGSATMTSGLSLKQFAGPTALQATLGCWDGCDGIGASLDFLLNMPALARHEFLVLAWNFGVGGALGVSDDELGAAAAFIVGLEVNFRALPIDLVLEWRPELQVVPGPELDLLEFGAHLRLYLW